MDLFDLIFVGETQTTTKLTLVISSQAIAVLPGQGPWR